jgi:hypothetical protein
MKLDVGQKVALAAASFIAVAVCIIAGSAASGGGGPGSNSPNNPGIQGNHFGQTAGGGPGFGQGNNSGVEGSGNSRSIASDASSGRSDVHTSFFQSSDKEEAIDIDVDKGREKAGNQGGRDTNQADTTGGTHVLTRISSETGVPMNTLQAQKSATGLGYGDLETANLLAKASGQSFDSIVAKFKAGEGWGKIAHDLGLNLGKIVSDAHRSSRATHSGQESGENSGKPSLIPGPGIRKDSIVFTGITPVPSASVSRGVNPASSARQ